MACSSYRISNTGNTEYIYYNYQRCDDTLWEYQSELKPGENNNFWAFNGTVSYSPFYLGSLEIKDKGPFPPSQGQIECLPITIESVVFINNQYVITFGNLSQNCSTIYLQYSTSGGFNPNVNYPSKLVEPCQQVVYIDSLPPTGSVLFRAQQWCDGLTKSDGFDYYTYESPCNSSCQYTMKFVDPTTDSESIFETFLPSFDNDGNATMLLRYWRDIYIKCPDTEESLYDRDQVLDVHRSNGVVYLVIYKRVRWLDMQNAGRIVIPTINPPSQDPTLYATPLANYLNSLNLGVTFYPGSEPSIYPGGGVWPNSNADNVVYYRINVNNTDGFDFDNGYYSNEEDINSTLRRYKFKFRVNCFTELKQTATLPCPKSENVNLALCMCIESNVGGFVGPDYSVQSPNNCYDASIQTGFSGLGNPVPSSKFLFDYNGFYLNPSYDGFCSFAGYNGCYINPACCIPPPVPCFCYLVRIFITEALIDQANGNVDNPVTNGKVYVDYIPCDSTDDSSITKEYDSPGTIVECFKYNKGAMYYFQNDNLISVDEPYLLYTCPDCGLSVPPTQDKFPCCPPSPPTFQLNYSEDDQNDACLGFNESCEDCFYYTQTGVTGITQGMVLYTDVSLETLAPAGYYAGIPFNIKSGIVVDEVEGFRILSGGVVSYPTSCLPPQDCNCREIRLTPSVGQMLAILEDCDGTINTYNLGSAVGGNPPPPTTRCANGVIGFVEGTAIIEDLGSCPDCRTFKISPNLKNVIAVVEKCDGTLDNINLGREGNPPPPFIGCFNQVISFIEGSATVEDLGPCYKCQTLTCQSYRVSNNSSSTTTVQFIDCNNFLRRYKIPTGILGKNIVICATNVVDKGNATWTKTGELCTGLGLILNYNNLSGDEICATWSGFTGDLIYYSSGSTTSIEDGIIVYTDSEFTNLAPNGFYAGYNLNGDVQYNPISFEIISAGTVSNSISCSNPLPTLLQLNYDTTGQTEACLGFNISCEECFYYTEPGVTGITEGMILYTDISLETLAPAGYYAGGPLPIVVDELEGFRIVSGGTVSDIVLCPPLTPTPTPTQTGTPTPTPTLNVKTFQLNYDTTGQTEACLGFNISCEDCYYYTAPSVTGITEGMILYTDISLETLAPAGYYAGGPLPIVVDEVEGFRIVSAGTVSEIVMCPTPTPTNTPTVTPTPSTTSPEPTSTPTPSPTPECLIITSSSGVTLSQCSGDTDRIYVNGWQTGVTFTITTSTAVTFSGNQVSLGGSVTESGLSLTSLDVTVNSIGGISESLFIECTKTTENVYLYYQIAVIPTALDCPQKILEIYYLVP